MLNVSHGGQTGHNICSITFSPKPACGPCCCCFRIAALHVECVSQFAQTSVLVVAGLLLFLSMLARQDLYMFVLVVVGSFVVALFTILTLADAGVMVAILELVHVVCCSHPRVPLVSYHLVPSQLLNDPFHFDDTSHVEVTRRLMTIEQG